jgi:hypothetical protein
LLDAEHASLPCVAGSPRAMRLVMVLIAAWMDQLKAGQIDEEGRTQ